MRNSFIKTIMDIAKIDDSVYVISGDAGFGVFEEFCSQKPERFLNSGIAEANTIGYAAGMALAGFNVFVYNIVPFVLYRCYEQVRNDICYQKLPVTIIGIGSGITYAPAGMTHYSVEDIALCRTLPNLTVISPIDPIETEAAVRMAYEATTPVYIRIAKNGEPNFRDGAGVDCLKTDIIRNGEKVAILSYGTAFKEAAEACDMLASDKIYPRLISVPILQPFPADDIRALTEDCHTIITLEEHYRSGGLASSMSELIAGRHTYQRMIPLALPDAFIHDVRTQKGFRQQYQIDAQAVVNAVRASV